MSAQAGPHSEACPSRTDSDCSTAPIANGQANGVDTLAQCIRSLVTPKLYDWNFNVFELAELSNGRPLYAITMALFEHEGMFDNWLLDRPVVERYLTHVEASYRANPYHNNTHAADVTQTAAVIMQHVDAQLASAGGLSKLEKFCIILSSAVHDLAHPGVNNDFLVKTRSQVAMTYNDRSVNENMHVSRAFQLTTQNDGMDIFARFSNEEYTKARAWILSMVLTTDMAVHFELLDKFKAALKDQPDPAQWKERGLLFQMLVHLADLANPSRPFPYALKWAENVVTEFMEQGDEEARRGMPVTPFCSRQLLCMPKAQLNFVKVFMRPTLEAFGTVAPTFVTLVTPCIEDTVAKWAFLDAAGVTHPQESYPEFPADLQQQGQQQQQQQQQPPKQQEQQPRQPPPSQQQQRAQGQ